MYWGNMYVAGTGVCLPPEVGVTAAIRAGLYDQDEADKTGQLAATVAVDRQGGPDLAVAAAREALTMSGYRSEDVGSVFHGLVFHAGLDLWNAASFIQRELGMRRCLPVEVRSGCNAALAGVQLACAFLAAHAEQPAALVTSAEVWPEPAIDRWRADSSRVFGDAGSALVVSRERGLARLLSIHTGTEPSLEALHRGNEPFSPVPSYPLDLTRRARAFQRTMPREEIIARRDAGMRAAVDQALADADATLDEVELVALPFVGRNQLEREFLGPLGLKLEQTAFDRGRRVGHTGPGDQLASLDYFARSGRLRAGDLILILGAGGGFVWTIAVAEAC